MRRLSRTVISGVLMILAVACARQEPAPTDNSTEKTASDIEAPDGKINRTTVFGPPRLSPSELDRFLKRAKRGDLEAMSTLSVHYFAGDEFDLGYRWLREAARLGDCDAILHLVEDDFRGVSSEEMPHWQNEKKRLGCDPERDARAKPIIRLRPESEPKR